MSSQGPRTAAGRAVLAEWIQHNRLHSGSRTQRFMDGAETAYRKRILAVEAEAAAPPAAPAHVHDTALCDECEQLVEGTGEGTPALPAAPAGLVEKACIAVAGPWFVEAHEKGRFAPMELAQRIIAEYHRLAAYAEGKPE